MDEQRKYIHRYHKVYVLCYVQLVNYPMGNLYRIFRNKMSRPPLSYLHNFHPFDHTVPHQLNKDEPKNGYFKYFYMHHPYSNSMQKYFLAVMLDIRLIIFLMFRNCNYSFMFVVYTAVDNSLQF